LIDSAAKYSIIRSLHINWIFGSNSDYGARLKPRK